jgi:hypothetical protein
MDLEAYRASAESFVSDLTRTYYRHYSGLDERYEIEPIYERHASLFTLGAVDELRSALESAAPGSEDRRRLRMLLDFAVEGHLGQATKELEAELAEREAKAAITVDGEEVGFRDSTVLQANEPDAERREEIERGRLELTERTLNPLLRELVERQHERAAQLGYASYMDLCERTKGLDLAALRSQTDAFSTATAEAYPRVLEPELRRRLGHGIAQLRRSDLPRFFRAADEDRHFPAQRLVESLLGTLQGLGIAEQPNVVLDVERRPNKSPRAFCAPVRVPDEVYLVIAPVGGRDDFSALFHEAGHTEHYAHVGRELAFEFRYLGDNAVTEAFAFLFEHLVEDPVWLERYLGISDPAELASYARANRLIYLRRYAAKLAYEMELHGADGSLDRFPDRYSALLGDALQIEWSSETFLADVDPGFYCSCYLRAWALETHLRSYLRSEFGREWFASADAGRLLAELWQEGQRRSPDELLDALTGERLDFRVLVADLGLQSEQD